MRLGIAEGVEVGAARDEGERDEQRADRAVAETVLEVQHDEQAEKRDGNLPRTALAPGKNMRGTDLSGEMLHPPIHPPAFSVRARNQLAQPPPTRRANFAR